MNDPIRLVDDVGFGADVRSALRLEAGRAFSGDEARVATSLSASIAAGIQPTFDPLAASPASAWGALKAAVAAHATAAAFGVGLVVGGAAVGAALSASSSPASSPVAQPQQSRAPLAPTTTMPAQPSPVPVPVSVAAPVPVPVPVPVSVSSPVSSLLSSSVSSPASADHALDSQMPASAPAPALATTPPAAPATLGAELRAFERARIAHRQGSHDVAIAELEDLLARYPNGRIASEARALLVDAFLGQHRFVEALAATDRWLPTSSLGAERGRLRAARVAALSALHRCDEAVRAAETDDERRLLRECASIVP